MLDWVYYGVLALLLVAGLFLNLLGLPGLWLMVAALAGYGWLTGWDQYVGWTVMLIVLALAILAEIVEFLAGAAGSKSAGGTKRAMVGAIVGGLVGGIAGSPFLPIIGTIIGAIVGSFLGAAVVELLIHRDMNVSLRVGTGAAKGRFWGILAKSAFGIAMLLVALLTALPLNSTPPPAPASQPASLPSAN